MSHENGNKRDLGFLANELDDSFCVRHEERRINGDAGLVANDERGDRLEPLDAADDELGAQLVLRLFDQACGGGRILRCRHGLLVNMKRGRDASSGSGPLLQPCPAMGERVEDGPTKAAPRAQRLSMGLA